MTKFSQRSYELELLDAPNIPKELLFKNLRELDVVNRLLGGHAITLSGIKTLVVDKTKTYRIVDIGCGGGDAMKKIAKWAKVNNFKVELIGVDMNADAVQFMKDECKEFSNITGIVSDYRDYLKSNTDVDIVHCSLFCHHLKDDELKELFQFVNKHAKVGFIINDLQRHWFAYYSIKFLTRLLNGSTLVKNDAPLSVLRGFRKEELNEVLLKAGIKDFSVEWKWAFRYLITKNFNTEQKE
ncbi:MAG TPA: methyltransferase domain-containing protein [Bacteroidia bacterium]|nr:methyltransferase domain-containing protein [Bacteroidia bacterium]